jgi:carboxyl-terminal processing protease
MVKWRSWFSIVVAFLAGWLSAMVLAGTPYAGDVARVIGPGSLVQLQTPWGLRVAFAPFWETWQLVDAVFFERDRIDHPRMIQGAINGMLATLDDRYTFYQEPEKAKQTSENMQGTMAGIGAYLRREEQRVVIWKLIADAPAEQAGLRAGDEFIRIDGVRVADIVAEVAADEVIARVASLLRGDVGTTVAVEVRRTDGSLLTVQLTRAEIILPSVEWQILPDMVGYITISDFKANTPDVLQQGMQEMKAAGVRGYILDLRGNPGGLLDSARRVLGLFYAGTALWEQKATGAVRELSALPPADYTFPTAPVVVLMDENSASASEVVAGALRDRVPGTQIIGVQSFGKGIVQNIYPLSNGGTTRLTVAQWLTPERTAIHGVGLTPDVIVANGDDTPADAPCVRQNQPDPAQTTCRDAPLMRALAMFP